MNFIQKHILKNKADRQSNKSFDDYLHEKVDILALPIAKLEFSTINYIAAELSYQSYDLGLYNKHWPYRKSVKKAFQYMYEPQMTTYYKSRFGKQIPVMFTDFKKESKPFTIYNLVDLESERNKNQHYLGYIHFCPEKYPLDAKNTWIIRDEIYPYQYRDGNDPNIEDIWAEPVTLNGTKSDLSKPYNPYTPSVPAIKEILEKKNCHTVRDLLVNQEWQKSLHILDINAVANALDNKDVDVHALQRFRSEAYKAVGIDEQHKKPKTKRFDWE